jgi:hypothetical protein
VTVRGDSRQDQPGWLVLPFALDGFSS